MTEVLVLIDAPDGKVTKPSLELLTIARRIGEPSAVVFGSADTDTLTQYGAEKIYTYDDAVYSEFLVGPKAEALAQLVTETSPAAVLVGASTEGKEISARVALKTESGWISDAVDVQASGDSVTTTQSVFAGNFTVQSSITKGAPVITVKPNSTTPEAAAGAGAVEAKTAEVSEAAKTAKITSTKVKEASGRPELTEAAIVVSGGRGTGGDFTEVEAFADTLGAAVGASRAAVDSGWYPHSFQVGQTGKTVSPQLYVANGISGAIQHRAGMQTSKTIVAVNKDDEAPIFELVDFGVVGDLKSVLPQATEEVKKRKG
ncbi:electron transfer flavoprotein subunit alpha/FixB family protein [Aeromicrobium sp. SMF47]|uniref:Electron transfer flavoprotein subunit alpha/FixB family protein n=1 Tax=Aeromicrobium yanjiei TaxID=2662028 RepID=A0A5Q2MJY5_9ACTN|nr:MULTISPECIES: electron transfer flavoprotein subunit alpha/FixB family protein [Aeromicrobium]MRJ76786.1 electron transfer flavoprotein subunit alpha/FixB family protein [Aeromicrobium yanjiei]MRK01130.1 electron transfer flavoprotein subunit alpha/FixB family protein [Aeromicrobium sp. S22]QGG42079.1 electron transfer flavoprotein subunit alpha/FixB family protein [Aeromicrobium yanjiei]